MTEPLMPLTDAAFQLRRSYHATLNLVLTGILPGSKVGGRWRVSRAAVEAMVGSKPPGA